jgi:hypothetical protein
MKGYSKGTQNKVLRYLNKCTHGYSTERRNCLGFLWQYLRDISARPLWPLGVRPVWYDSIYRVLTAYSQGTHRYRTGLAGSTSVLHVLHYVRARTCHTASGSASHHGARWCVWRYLTERYFSTLMT